MGTPLKETLKTNIISFVCIKETKELHNVRGTLHFILSKKDKIPNDYNPKTDKIINGLSLIVCKCSYCDKHYTQILNKLKKTVKGKFLANKIVCGGDKSPCSKLKQKEINELRQSQKCSPAQGRIVTEEEKIKRLTSLDLRYGEVKPWSEKRKGKSLEDQYGEEKASRVKKSLQEGYKKTFDGNRSYPHQGKPHSEETRELQSKKRLKFIHKERNEKNLNYISPLTGEKVDIFTFNSHVMLNWIQKMPPEEWEKRNSDNSERMTKMVLGRKSKSSIYQTGLIKNWFTQKEEFYESSYERRFFYLLNYFKVYWEKNTSLVIPYQGIDSKKGIRHYVPDILVYSDSSFSKLRRIIEIKPLKFQEMKINQIKYSALQKFCEANNLKCSRVDLIKIQRLERISQYEDKKNN